MNRPDQNTQWTLLDVEGDLDSVSGPEVYFRCRRELERGRVHLLLDLAGVGRVDSRGLGFLVRSCRDARRRGGEVALRRVPEPLLRVLEFTRLDGVFTLAGEDPPPLGGPTTEAA